MMHFGKSVSAMLIGVMLVAPVRGDEQSALPEGAQALSKGEIEARIVGNTLKGKKLGVGRGEYYNPNGQIDIPSNMYGGHAGTWNITGGKFCRKFSTHTHKNGCWLLAIQGEKVLFFSPKTGKLAGEFELLEGNPLRL